GGAAHDGVADVDLVARQLHLARFEHLREELSGAADERKPLRVLVGARTLADNDELRPRVPGAEHDGGAPLAELALAAALSRLFLGGERFGRAEEDVGTQVGLGESKIAGRAARLAGRPHAARE